jgi:hypothetical protein
VTSWKALQEELAAWEQAGIKVAIWWRDDDACKATQPLRRLLALANSYACPLALAVIPARVRPSLGDLLAEAGQGVFVLQHGYAHQNHAPAGEKNVELHACRNSDEVAAELAAGSELLASTLADRHLAVMVPPWNRIAPEVTSLLPKLGFRGLSTFGPCGKSLAPSGLTHVNCHLDILRWKPTRGFMGNEALLGILVDELRRRRSDAENPSEPLGLLTHHLVHDEDCWCFLDRLLTILSKESAVHLVSPATLFHDAEIETNAKPGRTGEAV